MRIPTCSGDILVHKEFCRGSGSGRDQYLSDHDLGQVLADATGSLRGLYQLWEVE